MDHQESSKFKEFVANNPLGNIHQTPEWGKFQSLSRVRDKYWPIIIEEKGRPAATALLIRQRLPKGKCWLYCPRGPLPLNGTLNQSACTGFFKKTAALAKSENAVFLRFDPPVSDIKMSGMGGFIEQKDAINQTLQIFKSAAVAAGLKLKSAHAHYQPETTLILDLTLSEEELLAQMKPKGRYNIKVAQKHEVKIKQYDAKNSDTGDLEKAVKSFYRLLSQTTSRDGFSGHPEKYYLDLLKTLPHDRVPAAPTARLYLAEYQGKIVAGTIVTHYRDTAIYYFGASGNEHRNVMAPYLLQWQGILDAKSAGLKYYDFLGIAPLKPAPGESADSGNLAPDPAHPWAKVTDFKLKFGGQIVNYIPAQEIIFQPFWYWLIRFVKNTKKLLHL